MLGAGLGVAFDEPTLGGLAPRIPAQHCEEGNRGEQERCRPADPDREQRAGQGLLEIARRGSDRRGPAEAGRAKRCRIDLDTFLVNGEDERFGRTLDLCDERWCGRRCPQTSQRRGCAPRCCTWPSAQRHGPAIRQPLRQQEVREHLSAQAGGQDVGDAVTDLDRHAQRNHAVEPVSWALDQLPDRGRLRRRHPFHGFQAAGLAFRALRPPCRGPSGPNPPNPHAAGEHAGLGAGKYRARPESSVIAPARSSRAARLAESSRSAEAIVERAPCRKTSSSADCCSSVNKASIRTAKMRRGSAAAMPSISRLTRGNTDQRPERARLVGARPRSHGAGSA